MRIFKLKDNVISVSALGNRIIEDKDPHSEEEFENVDELVKKGFLEEVISDEEAALAAQAEKLAKEEAEKLAQMEAEEAQKKADEEAALAAQAAENVKPKK
jgi:hypothetical protein